MTNDVILFSYQSDTVTMMKNPTPKVSVATEGKIGYLNLVTRAVDDRKQDSEELGIPVMTAVTERTVYIFPST